jgi:hypothetical protein
MSSMAKQTRQRTAILQGTPDMLILRTLLYGPAHGHEMGKHIQRTTNDSCRCSMARSIPLSHVADRWEASWMVSSQGLRMALAVGIGLVGMALAARSMASLLYGISALDPVTLGSASIALIAIAFAACALPAQRAARIDPSQALRTE